MSGTTLPGGALAGLGDTGGPEGLAPGLGAKTGDTGRLDGLDGLDEVEPVESLESGSNPYYIGVLDIPYGSPGSTHVKHP